MVSPSERYSVEVYLFALYRCQEAYVRAHLKGAYASYEQHGLLTDMYYLLQRIEEKIPSIPDSVEKRFFLEWGKKIRGKLQPLYDEYGDLNIILGVPYERLPVFPEHDAERLAAAVLRYISYPVSDFVREHNNFVKGIEFPHDVLVSTKEMRSLERRYRRGQNAPGARINPSKEPDMGLKNLNRLFDENQTNTRQSMEDIHVPASVEKAASQLPAEPDGGQVPGDENNQPENPEIAEAKSAVSSETGPAEETEKQEVGTTENDQKAGPVEEVAVETVGPASSTATSPTETVPEEKPQISEDQISVAGIEPDQVVQPSSATLQEVTSEDGPEQEGDPEVVGHFDFDGPSIEEKLAFFIEQQNDGFLNLLSDIEDASVEPAREDILDGAKVMGRFATLMRELASEKDALQKAPFKVTHLNVFRELVEGFEHIEKNNLGSPRALWDDFKFQMIQAHRLDERYGQYLSADRYAELLGLENQQEASSAAGDMDPPLVANKDEPGAVEQARSLVANKDDALGAHFQQPEPSAETIPENPELDSKQAEQAEAKVQQSEQNKQKSPDNGHVAQQGNDQKTEDVQAVSSVAEKIRKLLESYPSPDGDDSFRSVYGTDLSKIVKSISVQGEQLNLHLGGQKFMASKVTDYGATLKHTGYLRPSHIELMAEQARRKGWSKVVLGGRVVKKRGEAWAQLKALGIEVEGHTPSVADKARLEELIKRASLKPEAGLSISAA